MTRKEVSEIFGVTEMTVANWADKGLLERIPVSNKKSMITKASVDVLLEKFADIAQCEQEIRNYKSQLVEKRRMIDEAIKDARTRYELFRNTGSYVSLFLNCIEMVTTINERDKAVIVASLEGKSFDSISHQYSVGNERIRQIIAHVCKSLAKARNYNDICKENKRLARENEKLNTKLSLYEERKNIEIKTENPVGFLGCFALEDTYGEDNKKLSVRTVNALKIADKVTYKDLALMTEEQLLKTKNLGKKCVDEVGKLLASRNLHLGMSPQELLDYGKE